MIPLQKFKDCMSEFTTGVTIATTIYNKQKRGITINTFASLSLEPRLVLFNLKKDSFCYNEFIKAEKFAINILSDSQENISQLFTHDIPINMWSKLDMLPKNLPCFQGSLAYVECNTYNIYEGGDHSIIVGEVIELDQINQNSQPLIYFKRSYHRIENN